MNNLQRMMINWLKQEYPKYNLFDATPLKYDDISCLILMSKSRPKKHAVLIGINTNGSVLVVTQMKGKTQYKVHDLDDTQVFDKVKNAIDELIQRQLQKRG